MVHLCSILTKSCSKEEEYGFLVAKDNCKMKVTLNIFIFPSMHSACSPEEFLVPLGC